MLDDATVLDYALNLKEWYMGSDDLLYAGTDCTVQCHKIMAGILLDLCMWSHLRHVYMKKITPPLPPFPALLIQILAG